MQISCLSLLSCLLERLLQFLQHLLQLLLLCPLLLRLLLTLFQISLCCLRQQKQMQLQLLLLEQQVFGRQQIELLGPQEQQELRPLPVQQEQLPQLMVGQRRVRQDLLRVLQVQLLQQLVEQLLDQQRQVQLREQRLVVEMRQVLYQLLLFFFLHLSLVSLRLLFLLLCYQ